MSLARVLNVETDYTGSVCQLTGPEGSVVFGRVDPHGVVMEFNGQYLSIDKKNLPILARFFAAAGVLLGVDINEGWDAPEQTTRGFHV